MSELRAEVKQLFNALELRRPINFGLSELVDDADAEPESHYVPRIHGNAESLDPIVDLANQIDISGDPGTYLFTGNRGTGKTTELLRLAKLLRNFDCEVFYLEMSEYLMLNAPVEITDFLIAVFGALSERVRGRFGSDVARQGYVERIFKFLQSEVRFEGLGVAGGAMQFRASLAQAPDFKAELQDKMRPHAQVLIERAHEFAREVASFVREQREAPDKRIVVIIDSIERIKGEGSDIPAIRRVFKSVETLFSTYAERLQFDDLDVVCTVPPYLSALAGGLSAYYAGGRIYALPSVHIYDGRPAVGELPKPSMDGLNKMVAIVASRYADYGRFFSDDQVRRLAHSSGGDLRDYFRMLRSAAAKALQSGAPVPNNVIESVEGDVRNDLPLNDADRQWLRKVAHDHRQNLPSLDHLPDFARLQQGKYILQYRNGDDWYAPHPLLREELTGAA